MMSVNSPALFLLQRSHQSDGEVRRWAGPGAGLGTQSSSPGRCCGTPASWPRWHFQCANKFPIYSIFPSLRALPSLEAIKGILDVSVLNCGKRAARSCDPWARACFGNTVIEKSTHQPRRPTGSRSPPALSERGLLWMLGQQPPDIFEMFILSSVDTEVNMITKNKDLKNPTTQHCSYLLPSSPFRQAGSTRCSVIGGNVVISQKI